MSSWGQMAECPDSTCARVVHPNAEIGSENLVSRKECPEQSEKIGVLRVSLTFLCTRYV